MVSERVVESSRTEYSTIDCTFQWNKLENQPLNSPTAGDMPGGGEPARGDPTVKVERFCRTGAPWKSKGGAKNIVSNTDPLRLRIASTYAVPSHSSWMDAVVVRNRYPG